MKRIIIALLMGLLIPTICFSSTISNLNEKDSLIRITETQLKQTNIIFLEHRKLLKKDSVLSQQVLDLEKALEIYNDIDSIRNIQIKALDRQIEDNNIQIINLNNKLDRSKKKIRNRNYAIIFLSVLSFVCGYTCVK